MKYFGLSDKGTKRKNNQDSYVIATSCAGDIFAIVADGIGGNLGGDIASRLAIAYFSKHFSEHEGFQSEREVVEWLEENIYACNTEIFSIGKKYPKLQGMGTTFCGVLVTSIGTWIINIGDSRTYAYYRDGRFKQLTQDHNWITEMMMRNRLTYEQAMQSKHKNVLTNALGVWQSVRSDIYRFQDEVDGFLICSDGLHGYVDDQTIQAIVTSRKLDTVRKAKQLIQTSLNVGGYDNVTVILLDFEGDFYE